MEHMFKTVYRVADDQIELVNPRQSIMSRLKSGYNPTQRRFLKSGSMTTRIKLIQQSRELIQSQGQPVRRSYNNAAALRPDFSNLQNGALSAMQRFVNRKSQQRTTTMDVFTPKDSVSRNHSPNDTNDSESLCKSFQNEISKAKLERQIQKVENTLFEANRFGIEELKKLIKAKYNFDMKLVTATEAMMFCRGGNLQNYQAYDRQRLVDWLAARLPSLKQLYQASIKSRLKQDRSIKEKAKSINMKYDPILIKQKEDADLQETITVSHRYPKIKYSLNQQYSTIQSQMLEQSQLQGQLGQLAAQQRLSLAKKLDHQSRNQDIDFQINTLVKTSPASRSITLQRLVSRGWRESQNNFKIVSKLNEAQRKRVNGILYQRLNF